MSKNLFEGSSESETETAELRTNKEYAKSYNKFRGKELLKRLKDQEQNESGTSSDDGSESSEDEVVASKQFDEEFFKMLSSLKSKDPKIYDKGAKFFDNSVSDEVEGKGKRPKSHKPLTIKDYERKVILEKGGKYEDDASDEEETGRAVSPSYMEEQTKLRQELKKALNSDESDEDFGGIFRRREKTKQEKLKDDEQYAEWLAGKKEDIGEAAHSLHPLKEYWSNPKLPKQEQFLRDYILSNGYQGKDIEEIPTYDEIVNDFSDDEKELEKQAEFEQKFNFRFEEPDQEFIKRFPRTIETSVRKTDDRRKEKRLQVKERKLKEKELKYQELQILKEIKRKEIEEKIQKLKEVTGNDELPFKEDDLDEEFDPDAHDKRMEQIFNNEYYDVDEGEEKPECSGIEELIVEDWDNYDPEKDDDGINDDYEPHCEDDEFNMDCDYDPNAAKQSLQNELIENSKSRRKGRRRNQFMEMIKRGKPAFDPEDEITYAEYIDAYYKMDYEDMIGDTPCRFKYVETMPNDFGLTIEEILLAKNKELNQWVSLKKAVQIRPKNVELRDRKLYKMKAKNETLKRKIFVSLYGPPSEDEDNEQLETGSSINDTATSQTKNIPSTSGNGNSSNKKKNKSKKRKINTAAEILVSASAEEATGSSPTKTVTKIESPGTSTVTLADESATRKVNEKKVKKKKKSKKNKTVAENKSITELIKKSRIKIADKTRNPFKNNTKFRTKTGKINDETNGLSDERLRAYGINPRKFHKNEQFLSRKQNSTKRTVKNKSK